MLCNFARFEYVKGGLHRAKADDGFEEERKRFLQANRIITTIGLRLEEPSSDLRQTQKGKAAPHGVVGAITKDCQ